MIQEVLQEVRGDGGAPTAGGGDSDRRPATPRMADAAGQRVPVVTDASDPRDWNAPATSSGRQGLLRRRLPLLLVVPHPGQPPPHGELLLLLPATSTTTTFCCNQPHQTPAAGEVLYSSGVSLLEFVSFVSVVSSSREIVHV